MFHVPQAAEELPERLERLEVFIHPVARAIALPGRSFLFSESVDTTSPMSCWPT
ncbi:MAG: hypothetical protein ACKO45_07665 [Cyanobium sp.]